MNLLEQLMRENQEVSKKKANSQRKAMFANGYKGESKKVVRESVTGNAKNYLLDKVGLSNKEVTDIIHNATADEIETLALQWLSAHKDEDAVNKIINKYSQKKVVKERIDPIFDIDTIEPGFKFTNGKSTIEVKNIRVYYDSSTNDFSPVFECLLDGEPREYSANSFLKMFDQEDTVIKESKKVVKEGITPDNYKIYRTTIDFATDGTRPVAKPGSPFENAIYKALEDLGYIVMNDSYSFDFEDVTDIYPVEDLEDWMFEDN